MKGKQMKRMSKKEQLEGRGEGGDDEVWKIRRGIESIAIWDEGEKQNHSDACGNVKWVETKHDSLERELAKKSSQIECQNWRKMGNHRKAG
jgi:hypothetical protein